MKLDGKEVYLSGTGTTTTMPTNVTSEDATIYKSYLYTKTTGTKTRLDALKEASAAFIDVITANAVTTGLKHRISIVKFGAFLTETIGNDTSTWADCEQNYTQIVNDLQSVSDYAGTMKSTINNFIVGGSTPADWGLMLANCVLSGTLQYTDYYEDLNDGNHSEFLGYQKDGTDAKDGFYYDNQSSRTVTGTTELARHVLDDDERKAQKVVVFFTDGEPYMQVKRTSDKVETRRNVKEYAVREAKNLKNSGATIYSIAVLGGTSDTSTLYDYDIDGKQHLGETQFSLKQYLSYVSSNYPNATSMFSPGDQTSSDYYKLAEGDLTKVFSDIAKAVVSGGAKADLTEDLTSVVDVFTSDFVLPAGTSTNSIKTYKIPATGGAGTAASPYTFDDKDEDGKTLTKEEYILTTTTVSGSDGNYSITGYDFSKKDKYDDTYSTITEYGNWVGERIIGNVSQGVHGNKLRIVIPVTLAADFAGGYDDKTNTGNSCVKYKEEEYAWFPIPSIDIPVIAISKSGLKYGESAVFEVKQNSGEGITADTDEADKPVYYVTLTGKDANGSEVFTFLKNMPEGNYTVTEKSWSWAYSTETPSVTKELKDNVETYQGLKCAKFSFANTPKDKLPDHAEAIVKNKFKGGNLTASPDPETQQSKTN